MSDVCYPRTLCLDTVSICERGAEMPKTSRETATRVEDMGVMEGRYSELGGYTVGFETFRVDADAAPIYRGLPDDRCQSPHWGYVLRGRLTLRYADHDEEYAEGDAYFAPPGHVPAVTAGTEVVEFSPTEAMGRTMEVVARNLAAAGAPE
jgi:hypothetical protein